ncbi:MAG TPA: PEP/pyruvate-binding domain-containing protein [Acidimicrobiales bacterium]|nr:PEP/pyruvate-binding domain-containing protein [Acidimicrobiales bacterium]
MDGARPRPALVHLGHTDAGDASLTGAKAANLAIAQRAGLPVLPGMVLTTAWNGRGWSHPSRLHDRGDSPAWTAWRQMSDDGRRPVVVRSSSTNEDGGTSSMAGVFTSVLDVADRTSFVQAVDDVLASARSGLITGAPMAVLVQPQLSPRWGGVLFGADPISGRTDRLLLSACEGGPDRLVSGLDDGWTATLSPRGRVVQAEPADGALGIPSRALRTLAKLAKRAATAFGGPQDIEWAIDDDGAVWLLQSRPITTTTGKPTGPVLGTGPLAETFPDPLSPLEADLWLAPMREGLEHALSLTGTMSARALRRAPVARQIDGWAVANLEALGSVPPRHRILRKIDPRPGARKLRAAWRVGRLARALPAIGRDVIAQIDGDLLDVPRLDDLGNAALLAVLDNGRTTLRALHGYEALSGMLVPEASTGVTAASIAMSALAEARAEDVDIDDLTRHNPVVLALTPPRVGPDATLSTIDLHTTAASAGALSPRTGRTAGLGTGATVAAPVAPVPDPDGDAVVREALRLRARWVQELTARAAWQLGYRLVSVGVLPGHDAVRLLSLDELRGAALHRAVPDDLATRTDPGGAARALPAQFRLTADGRPLAVVSPSGQGGVGAGGGVGIGPAHLSGEPPAGAVLVVTHLDPRLATVIPRLAGLVAETGSPLSHLAILAREHGIPTVVGHAGATTTYCEAQRLEVDGTAGTVRIVDGDHPSTDTPDPSTDERPADVSVVIPTALPIEIGARR